MIRDKILKGWNLEVPTWIMLVIIRDKIPNQSKQKERISKEK